MTAKRFEYNHEKEYEDYIYDIEDNRMMWELDCICDLLNDLNTFRIGYFNSQKEIKKLREETHRLRLTKIHLSDLEQDIQWLKKHWDDNGENGNE